MSMNTSLNQIKPEIPRKHEKTPNRRERRRAETRERIVRCALRLFSERGVTATTIEDITNAADIGKGTFFNYFPTKEHILAHLCQLQMGKIRAFVAQAMHSGESVDRVLYKLALIITEEFARSPELVRGILAPFFSSESAHEQMADDLEQDREILAELMAARQQRCEVREDYTPTELALQVQRALFGTTILWSLDPSKPLSECLQDMINVLWSGIRSETTRNGQSLPSGRLA
jgi:AcrR family transcriptional regulator